MKRWRAAQESNRVSGAGLNAAVAELKPSSDDGRRSAFGQLYVSYAQRCVVLFAAERRAARIGPQLPTVERLCLRTSG
jgi:hypothetical protein